MASYLVARADDGTRLEEGHDAKLAIARHWRKEEMLEEALPFYWEAIALDPKPSLLNELGVVLRQLGKEEEEEYLYDQALEAGVWKLRDQRPLQFLPELRAKPWWDIEEIPTAKALEESYPAIKAEFLKLLENNKFVPYQSNAVRGGEWSEYVLFKNGVARTENCEECPETVAALKAIPGATTESKGNVYFSRLAPYTHLRSHCGPTNTRIRIHLALQVPPKPNSTKIRVVDETREWEEGKCLIFDDSFEHEVWNFAEQRINLVVDTWHPDLKTAEQQAAAFATAFYA